MDTERRQLTVLFCDLVGSTKLVRKLDPEDMHDLMRRVRKVFAEPIAAYEGYVAQILGDGILAYFGWPTAHEDDADRAVHAGVALASAVKEIELDENGSLAARVGISTGRVVVGSCEHDATAIGETPHLAARLQELAKPNEVMIDSRTRRLISNTFDLVDRGKQALKGFADPVEVWCVLGERSVKSRFEARGGAQTPFVGREAELNQLTRLWSIVRTGKGQVVVLSGEPGIGKSRLIWALKQQVVGDSEGQLQYQCSPYHTRSALYPFSHQIEQSAGFGPLHSVEEKVKRLNALLKDWSTPIDFVPAFYSLVSLPCDRPDTTEELPFDKKERVFAALTWHVLSRARKAALLAVFEDVHWIDPMSEEFLASLAMQIADAPILLVLTHRQEWRPGFSHQSHVSQLRLERLRRREVADLVRLLGRRDELSANVIQAVANRAEGIPLFVEELTRFIIETGKGRTVGDEGIPNTLEASLLARIDRLGGAREIAQTAAVIGREFDCDLLQEVTNLSNEELNVALNRLVFSGLVLRRRSRNTTSYAFKHSLVQEIAYESLLKRRRRDLHERIATVVQENFPEIGRTRPEFVAHHLTLGGADGRAVDFWEAAAELASRRSANIEAASHCQKALGLLPRMDCGTANRRKELQILLRYSSALRATAGFGANATGEACYRACSLARELEEPAQLLLALNGVYSYHLVRGEHEPALRAAEELAAVAHQRGDETYEMIGGRALGAVLFHTGRATEAVPYLEEALDRYDMERHRQQLLVYGADHAETCACFLSMARWILGEPERAFELQYWAVQHARKLGHAFTLVQALAYLAFLHALSRDWMRTKTVARQLISLADRHAMSQMRAFGEFLIRRTLDAADAFERTSPGNYRPFVLTVVAESHLKAGLPVGGLELISVAEQRMRRSNELWCEPELYRVRGELLALSGHLDKAALALEAGIEAARRQRARMWELRCALATARLFRTSDAFANLVHVRSVFANDLAMADIRAADQLLWEWRRHAKNE